MNKGETVAKDTSLMGMAMIMFATGITLIQSGQIYSGTLLFVVGFAVLAAKYYWRLNGKA